MWTLKNSNIYWPKASCSRSWSIIYHCELCNRKIQTNADPKHNFETTKHSLSLYNLWQKNPNNYWSKAYFSRSWSILYHCGLYNNKNPNKNLYKSSFSRSRSSLKHCELHHLLYYFQLMKSFIFQLLFSPLSHFNSVPDCSISMLLAFSVEKII